jgi:single-stranded-DNA-specific exonuclease
LSFKKWVFKSFNEDEILKISKENDISFFSASLLNSRGITNKKEVEEFLSEDNDMLLDPYDFKDMKKAVDRIKKAIHTNELICIFGDYDADGVTSVSIMYSFLKKNKANVTYYIPDRNKEGYGMNISAVENLKKDGVSLIIATDNGITANNEVEVASLLGMDTIIVDHHRPCKVLPRALAIIDPHQPDCVKIKFKDFCAAGLVLFVVLAFSKNFDEKQKLFKENAAIASIGTIGDSVLLKSYNRKIVKQGLKEMSNCKIPSLSACFKEFELQKKQITSLDIAFSVVPRINAVGRISSCKSAVELLLEEDFNKALILAKELGDKNIIRKEIEIKILKEALEFINLNPSCKLEPIIVVFSEGWHSGVIGIVASKLVEKYGKPCVVISIEEEIARGSGRSVGDFSLINAIKECSEFLIRFGGHPMAAGFEMNADNVLNFSKRINDIAKKLEIQPCLSLEIESILKLEEVNMKTAKEIKSLGPFGCGNLHPIFSAVKLTIVNITPVGKGMHLRLSFKKDSKIIFAMKFSTTKEEFEFEKGDIVNIAFEMCITEFKGQTNVSVFLKDVHPYSLDVDSMLESEVIYEEVCRCFSNRSENLKADIAFFVPDRENFVDVYKKLQICLDVSKRYTVRTLYCKLKLLNFNFAKFLLILDIMIELNIITKTNVQNETFNIFINKLKRKVNLDESLILKFLKEERSFAGKQKI